MRSFGYIRAYLSSRAPYLVKDRKLPTSLLVVAARISLEDLRSCAGKSVRRPLGHELLA